MPISTTYTLKDFGATSANPAIVLTNLTSLQLFTQPSAVPAVGNAGIVAPPSWSTPGTPQNFGYQGRVQMPGQLLVAPGTGSLNGKYYQILAGGTITVPSSASGVSFNLVMNQNYFAFGQAPQSDTIFTLSAPIAVANHSVTNWTMSATLAGNGIGTPTLSCAGFVGIGATQYVGNGFSTNKIPGVGNVLNAEPIIQLSFGVQFSGTPGSSPFQATLSQFQMVYTTP